MFTPSLRRALGLAVLGVVLVGLFVWLVGDWRDGPGMEMAGLQGPGLGQSASEAEIAGWDISIPPDGAGLPAGRGSAVEGAVVYAQKCVECHGPKGRGRTAEELVGGVGALASDHPEQTVGSYWPYATTLFDYIRRAMPPEEPFSLSADEIYAVCAYLLFLNGIIGESDEINAATLRLLAMPNREGFTRINPEARRTQP